MATSDQIFENFALRKSILGWFFGLIFAPGILFATPPNGTIVAPGAGQVVGGSFLFVVNADDGGDGGNVTNVDIAIDGNPIGGANQISQFTWSMTINSGSWSDGFHTIDVTISDDGGESIGIGENVFFDNTVPNVSITAPLNNATVSGTVAFSANATDNVAMARVEFYVGSTLLNSDTSAPFAFNWDTTGMPNGAVTLTAKAVDSVGNNTTSNPINVTISNSVPDTTPPTGVAITSPTGGTALNGTVTISGTATDNVGVTRMEFFVDSTLINSDPTPPFNITWDSTGVGDGAHSLTAKAYDAANNSTLSPAVSVTVDNAPPKITSMSPANGAVVNGIVPVNVTANDNFAVARVEFYVDGALVATDANQPYSYSLNTSSLTIGGHAILVKAFDTSNNSSSDSITVTVQPATASPGVKSVSAFNPRTGSEAIIRFNLDNTSHVEVKIYTMDGALVKDAFNADMPAGAQEVHWNGRNSDGEICIPGIYVARRKIEGKIENVKIGIDPKL